MKRTVLYYPAISVPDGPWLRRALFYFDEVASIVPQEAFINGKVGKLLMPASPEVEFLMGEKCFRPITPERFELEDRWPPAHQLAGELLQAVQARGYRRAPGEEPVRVHRGKVPGTILQRLEALEGRQLIQYDALPDRWYTAQWLLVEKQTARLYMAMLAQFLADLDGELTVPGTDRTEDEDLIYRAPRPENGFPCIETRFIRALPTPREDVSLADILAFKRKRENELLEYRARVDALQQQLSAAQDRWQVKQALAQFEEAQRKEVKNLADAMADARIATVWGSLRTLIKTSTPAIWGAGFAAMALGAVPAPVALGGLAVAGTVDACAYLVDRRNEKRAAGRKSAFAYVQHGGEEGIV